MQVLRGLLRRISLSRPLTQGCEYNDTFRLNVPQHRNVVKVTARHDKGGKVMVHQQIQALYGQTSGFQWIKDEPNSGFACFRQKVSKYNALHAPIDNFTFENVRLPSDHVLFPHLLVVSLDISQHDISRIERYVSRLLDSKPIYFYIQACDVHTDTLRKNMFICCNTPSQTMKLVRNVGSIEKIPGREICYEKNEGETVDNALMYRYLPRYIENYYLNKIKCLVFEWGSFKAADHRTVYKMLGEFGSVESLENIGENKLRVTYNNLQRSRLVKAFLFTSILGRGTLDSPIEDDTNMVYVYIERDNQLCGALYWALSYSHSFDLYNVPSDPAEHVTQQSNVEFVGELLTDIEYNPGFISATYDAKLGHMRVLVEHAAYVEEIVTKVNDYVGTSGDTKYGNIEAVNVYERNLLSNDNYKEGNVLSTKEQSQTV